MVWGSFEGPSWWTDAPRNCPNQNLYRYSCALRFLSQWISITSGFDEKSQRLSSRPNKIPRLTRLWNPRSRKARDPSTSSGQALGHPAGWGSGMAFCFLPALDPHFVPIKKSSLTKARPPEGIFFWMQSARHDKRYATSGIAAPPSTTLRAGSCKKRTDGATTFRYGKRRTEHGEGWARPRVILSRESGPPANHDKRGQNPRPFGSAQGRLCVCKERRHKDGAPLGVVRDERVGQPQRMRG